MEEQFKVENNDPTTREDWISEAEYMHETVGETVEYPPMRKALYVVVNITKRGAGRLGLVEPGAHISEARAWRRAADLEQLGQGVFTVKEVRV
jgi:hypothetical protein